MSSWFDFEPVTSESVCKIINSAPSKSNGLDPVPTHMVKSTSEPLSVNISNIVQASLKEGNVPQSLKIALVTPVIKKASLDRNIMKNYRPISNLAFIGKVLEKVVASQLHNHLSTNGLLEPYQSAYCAGCSTETALLRVHNDVIVALSKGRAVLLVLLDLSAAFDTVDHDLLIAELAGLGMGGTVLQWFRSYLTGRVQHVCIGNNRSDAKTLTCGVPQGSVLGPILFTTYTSSLGSLLRRQNIMYHLYADDTQLYLTFHPSSAIETSQVVSQMEACVSLVKQWMSSHFLKMNDSKTEVLVITSNRCRTNMPIPSINIGEHPIDVSQDARNIDSHFQMVTHIKAICRKSYWSLKNISRLRQYVNQEALKKLVHATITSNLDYCNSLLLGLPKQSISMLQRVQNSAARVITSANYKQQESVTPLLKDLHWLPIDKRVEFKVLVIVYKCIHGLAPAYLEELLKIKVNTRDLRSSNRLELDPPFTRSALAYERAFSYAGPRLWNKLPCTIKESSSINVFKSNLKTHLFKEAFK